MISSEYNVIDIRGTRQKAQWGSSCLTGRNTRNVSARRAIDQRAREGRKSQIIELVTKSPIEF